MPSEMCGKVAKSLVAARLGDDPDPFIFVYVAGDRVLDEASVSVAQPDAVIIDLEESVLPDRFVAARESLGRNCAAIRAAGSKPIVRVKGFDSAEGELDARSVAALPADIAVMLPKPVTQTNVTALEQIVGARELWLMGEETTFADRLPNLRLTLAALSGIVIGSKDLKLDLERLSEPDRPSLVNAMAAIVRAGKDRGLLIVGSVVMGDVEALLKGARSAKRIGCDGITLVRMRDVSSVRQGVPAQ